MRDALQLADIDNDDSTYLHYGLFKEFDTLGETDEAWASLMAGAQARRSVTTTTPPGNRRLRCTDRGDAGLLTSMSAAMCRAM
jgi:hypothetical protein